MKRKELSDKLHDPIFAHKTMLATCMGEASAFIAEQQPPLFDSDLGKGVVLAGLGLFGTSAYQLVRFAHAQKPFTVKIDGIHGVIRHSSYLGFRVMATGLFLLNPTAYVFMGAAGVFAGTEYVARMEENNLIQQFPKEYSQYKQAVGRWLPKIFK